MNSWIYKSFITVGVWIRVLVRLFVLEMLEIFGLSVKFLEVGTIISILFEAGEELAWVRAADIGIVYHVFQFD